MRCELLADPALYDMQSMRAFCGLELVGAARRRDHDRAHRRADLDTGQP